MARIFLGQMEEEKSPTRAEKPCKTADLVVHVTNRAVSPKTMGATVQEPAVFIRKKTALRKVMASFGHTSQHESSNHRDLRDHLNNQLHNWDLRERLNDHRLHRDANQGRGDVHDGTNPDPVNQQIHEL